MSNPKPAAKSAAKPAKPSAKKASAGDLTMPDDDIMGMTNPDVVPTTRAAAAAAVDDVEQSKTVAKAKVYDAMTREACGSLEQVWTNAFWVFKHGVGSGAQYYAMHIEPGLFRTLSKLDELGLDPRSLTSENHARKLTAADLGKHSVPNKYLNALNFWVYKEFGTRMSVNSLYGDATSVDSYRMTQAEVAAIGQRLGERRYAVVKDAVLGYIKSAIPLRDAAFLLSTIIPAADRSTSALVHYNSTIADLRTRKGAKIERTLQDVAVYSGIHAWVTSARATTADTLADSQVVWPLEKYSTVNAQADAFFQSLDWSAAEKSSEAIVGALNESAMLRYKKEHIRSQE